MFIIAFPLITENANKLLRTNDNIVVFKGSLLNVITLDILNGLHIKLLFSFIGIFNELPIIIVTIILIHKPSTNTIPLILTLNIESSRKNEIINNGIKAFINE
jgi:hypothetical protein